MMSWLLALWCIITASKDSNQIPPPLQLYQRDIRTGEMTLIYEREEFIGLKEAALELIPQYSGRT